MKSGTADLTCETKPAARNRRCPALIWFSKLMGLNFKDSDAQWSYGGFMAFRERLASEIGVELRTMQGFSERTDDGKIPGERSWKNINDDIVPFLNHSDCEDELTPEECKRVAPRLRKLVADWEDDHDKQNALQLADDMERIAATGAPLVFC